MSHRDRFGQWDPKNQRPELWNIYNSQLRPGEQVRVFPLSNWTELDVWLYIRAERLALPSIYFAHERRVVERDGMLLSVDPPFLQRLPDERPFPLRVRFRTVGDVTCTGAVPSSASTVDEIIHDVLTSKITERGAGRADDRTSAAAMERRKREGYF